MRYHHWLRLMFFLLSLTLVSLAQAAPKTITIAGKPFTEQYLLVAISKLLLEQQGFEVNTVTGITTLIARQALLNGEIDFYYEYTGTGYTVFYKQSDPAIMTNPEKVYDWIHAKDKTQGLIWLPRVQFNNTYAIAMREVVAKTKGINTISDYAHYNNETDQPLTIGLNVQILLRPDGLLQLMKEYGFELPFDKLYLMNDGLVYLALFQAYIDSGIVYTTDGRIDDFKFRILEDDRHFFPVYNPSPVVRQQTLAQYSELPKILAVINDKLTTETIRRLNAKVDIEHQTVESVARTWLQEQGLL